MRENEVFALGKSSSEFITEEYQEKIFDLLSWIEFVLFEEGFLAVGDYCNTPEFENLPEDIKCGVSIVLEILLETTDFMTAATFGLNFYNYKIDGPMKELFGFFLYCLGQMSMDKPTLHLIKMSFGICG